MFPLFRYSLFRSPLYFDCTTLYLDDRRKVSTGRVENVNLSDSFFDDGVVNLKESSSEFVHSDRFLQSCAKKWLVVSNWKCTHILQINIPLWAIGNQ